MITVTLIGAGNVAQHLYRAFSTSDKVHVCQWFNRHLDTIQKYKNEVDITDDISSLKEADIYIIAVSDDAIANISKKLPFTNKLVLHTSGSVNMHHLDKKNHRGVFYPLQTFTKGADLNFEDVPICIEALEKSDLKILKDLAEALGSPFYKINTEQRQNLHLSAVYVNNFTNQLYRIAHEISDAKGINFDILKPLILEKHKY